MANLKTNISLGYGPNKMVKSWVKNYEEARSIVKEIDSSDDSHQIISFDESGTLANSLKDCKTMVLCNEGRTALEVSILATLITHAAPDTAGSSGTYVKLFLGAGESFAFPNGRMALYAEDKSICLGDSDTITPGATGTLYVETGSTLNTDLENDEDHLDVTDRRYFKVGDYVQVGINATTATQREVFKVTAITAGTGNAGELAVDRQRFGSPLADKDNQTNATSGAVSGAKVYWPFFNAHYNHDKALRGSSQLPITDQRGRWKAYNLAGLGRNTVTSISGIVPGSVAVRFYTKAFQDIAFDNPIQTNDSTGLVAATTYQFNITVADSASTSLAFTTSNTLTFGGSAGVIQTINNALDAAYKNPSHGLYGYKAVCSLVGGQLRFTDGTNMHAHDATNGSKILLADSSGSDNDLWGTGVFPAIADVLAAFSPALGDATVTDPVTGTTTTNDAAYMIDDSNGNLIYPSNGTTKVGKINYITGEHSFQINNLPYASFELTANSNSGFSGGLKSASSTSGNHIHIIKARSINTKVNGKIGAYIFK